MKFVTRSLFNGIQGDPDRPEMTEMDAKWENAWKSYREHIAKFPRVIDGRAEAQLVVIACSTPPTGRDHWTLQMLCDEMKRLAVVKSVCCETVRQALKKTNFAPGLPSGSASPKKTGPGSSRGCRPFISA